MQSYVDKCTELDPNDLDSFMTDVLMMSVINLMMKTVSTAIIQVSTKIFIYS